MIKGKRARATPAFFRNVEKALRIAVTNTIEEHRRMGDPIVVWKNGRVVKIPASKIPPRKMIRRPPLG